MTPLLERKLIDKYPKLFRQASLSIQESCMAWGIDTGDGWYQILEDLCEELSQISGVEFAQIKNKFGLLRIYIDNPTEEANLLIGEAEIKSAHTCESCGFPGEQDGWIIRCEKC